MSKTLRILAVIFGILAFLLLCASTGGTSWKTQDIFFFTHSRGLWRECIAGSCISYIAVPGWLDAVRALMTLAVLVTIAGIVMSIISAAKPTITPIAAGCLYTFSALAVLIGMSVYTAKIKATSFNLYSFGWSYVIGWVSMLVLVATQLISIFGGVLRPEKVQPPQPMHPMVYQPQPGQYPPPPYVQHAPQGAMHTNHYVIQHAPVHHGQPSHVANYEQHAPPNQPSAQESPYTLPSYDPPNAPYAAYEHKQ